MSRVGTLLRVAAFALLASPLVHAQDGWCKPTGCTDYACAAPCEKVCRASCEWIKVKKKSWKVECEDVCIPAVTVPSFCEVFKSAIGMRGTVGALPTRLVGGNGCTSCGSECGGQCEQPCNYGCAQVRSVRRLKSHTDEIEVMVVKWEIQGGDDGCTKSGEDSSANQPAPPPTAPAKSEPPADPKIREKAPVPPDLPPARSAQFRRNPNYGVPRTVERSMPNIQPRSTRNQPFRSVSERRTYDRAAFEVPNR